MVSFKRKKVEEPGKTLAEILVEARTEQEKNISMVVKETKVQEKYLLALESGNYSIFPGQVYGRNFLRAYVSYLGLDIARLIELFDKEYNLFYRFKDNSEKPETEFKPRSKPSHFIVFPKIARNMLVVAIIVLLLGYLGFRVKTIITPPPLDIFTPEDNLVVRDYQVDIVGQTEKEATLLINNEKVLLKGDGSFSRMISLKDGLNIIEIRAGKKHSRENIVERHVLVVKNGDGNYVSSN